MHRPPRHPLTRNGPSDKGPEHIDMAVHWDGRERI